MNSTQTNHHGPVDRHAVAPLPGRDDVGLPGLRRRGSSGEPDADACAEAKGEDGGEAEGTRSTRRIRSETCVYEYGESLKQRTSYLDFEQRVPYLIATAHSLFNRYRAFLI